MQITRHDRFTSRRLGKGPSGEGSDNRDSGILDRFRGSYDKLNIHLDQPEYQNIDELQAAKMLGHFTQKMQSQGYPWKLYAAKPGKKGFVKGEKVSDMEVLRRLQKGEAILMQPQRDLQLDLSSGSITALAAAGSVGGTAMDPIGRVATYSKNAQVSAGSQGLSLNFGEPILINSLAELKLLNQMYDPEQKIEGKSETAQAAHQFSYFTQKTVGSAFPWRFYTKDSSNPVWRVTKAGTKGAVSGAAIGAVVGGVAGGVLALAFRDWSFLKGGAAVGAAVGGARGGFDAIRTSRKGTPVNAVEALERVLEKEEVVFQESRVRSIGVPVLGKLSWFSDQGKGSSITSPEELNTFYYMQSGADLPKPKAEPKKEEKKPEAPTTIIVDQSVHHHYTSNDIGVGIINP